MNKENIKIRKLEKNDFDLLSDFLAINAIPRYSKSDYHRRFYSWWVSNPAFQNTDTMGWIIVDANSTNYIKGFLGNIPADYFINGNVYKTASPSTWIVTKNYKNYSLKLLFFFLKQKKDILINSTPGKLTELIFLKLGFTDIAKKQNNYIFLYNHKPIEYFLNHKIFKFKLINKILSKIFFFLYQSALILKFVKKRPELEYQTVTSASEIKKLLQKQSIKLINLAQILKLDTNKFFLKILREDKTSNFIYIQYVNNPVNKLKYMQVLETDINSYNLIKNVALKLADKKNYILDYIVVCNSSEKGFLHESFVKFNLLSRSKCLIKSEKIKINNINPSGSLGEKGFIIWN
jgi:hypothetical protein